MRNPTEFKKLFYPSNYFLPFLGFYTHCHCFWIFVREDVAEFEQLNCVTGNKKNRMLPLRFHKFLPDAVRSFVAVSLFAFKPFFGFLAANSLRTSFKVTKQTGQKAMLAVFSKDLLSGELFRLPRCLAALILLHFSPAVLLAGGFRYYLEKLIGINLYDSIGANLQFMWAK